MIMYALTAAYATLTLVLAANLVYLAWWRRVPRRAFCGRVSVLIPARNEERNLGRLLPSLLSQRDVDVEIIVYDDASEDATAAVVERCADPRIRLVRGAGPPRGWIGKVHALYEASRHATGDALLFLDADTRLRHRHALARIAGRFAALPAHTALTALPRFRGGASLVVSAVPYGILAFLPLPLARRGGRLFAALNGQGWMIARDDYFRHEPHFHHPAEVLEDVRIGRFLAGRGVTPHFADLTNELEVWMYSDLSSAWRGFRKNAYLGVGGHPLPFLVFFTMFGLTHIVAPAASLGLAGWLLALKALTDRAVGVPPWVSLLAPVTFLLCLGILLDSAVATARGTVTWKGRAVGVAPS